MEPLSVYVLGQLCNHCMISNREGLGTSLKEHTEIHKIPKFGVNQASFDWDTAI